MEQGDRTASSVAGMIAQLTGQVPFLQVPATSVLQRDDVYDPVSQVTITVWSDPTWAFRAWAARPA